jgi:DNA-binding GntR family transcriptional regulator
MNKGYCWPSEETIAKEASCSISTVKKAIKGLQEKNLLRKTRVKKYRSNMYETTI